LPSRNPLKIASLQESRGGSLRAEGPTNADAPEQPVLDVRNQPWPVWDNENTGQVPRGWRDIYKYIHDHALRLANKRYTPLVSRVLSCFTV
jgi:hypothetical protein